MNIYPFPINLNKKQEKGLQKLQSYIIEKFKSKEVF